MFGCLSWLITDISRRNRSIADRVAALSGTISLRATIRPDWLFLAWKTTPIPPRPNWRMVVYVGTGWGEVAISPRQRSQSHWIESPIDASESSAMSVPGGALTPQPAQVKTWVPRPSATVRFLAPPSPSPVAPSIRIAKTL
jgi:hypothetical protein